MESRDEEEFLIERDDVGSGAYREVGREPAGTPEHLDAGLVPGVLYTYRVFARNRGGRSAPSNPDSGRTPGPDDGPLPPGNLRAFGLPGSIRLVWNDNSQDETGFEIERRESEGVWEHLKDVPGGSSAEQKTDDRVQPERLYYYRIRSVRDERSSDTWSNEASAEALRPDSVRVTPIKKTFPSTFVGRYRDATIAIENRGNGNVDIQPAIASDAFSIVSGGELARIRSGERHVITVRFAPPREGKHRATLNILLAIPRHVLREVSLLGTGAPSRAKPRR